MENKKVTKKEYFEAIKAVVEGMDMVGEIPAEDVVKFCEAQIGQLDSRSEKAKAKAADKKAEGDALRAKIADLITDEWQTADEITAQVDEADISRQKVIARLTQLVTAQEIVKTSRKVGDKKVMCYRSFAAGEAE